MSGQRIFRKVLTLSVPFTRNCLEITCLLVSDTFWCNSAVFQLNLYPLIFTIDYLDNYLVLRLLI